MGAVYRATDTKLNRDIAIKILPDALANDPTHLARFTREAQVLAALNHLHIAPCTGSRSALSSWKWSRAATCPPRSRSRMTTRSSVQITSGCISSTS